jgi:hypothetical protein
MSDLELGKNNGIFRKMGNTNFAKNYISHEDNPVGQLAKSKLLNVSEVNNLTRLLSWCTRHHVEQGLYDITVSLIARNAVGGNNLALAAMVETGIISPEAMGVTLSKGAMKALNQENEKKQQKIRELEASSHRPGD